MIAAHGRQIVHGVEGRDLIDAHIGHIELAGDIFHHRHGQPALRLRFRTDLPLGEIEQRHHGGLLAAGGIAGDDLLGLRGILCRPRKRAPARAGLGFVRDMGCVSH